MLTEGAGALLKGCDHHWGSHLEEAGVALELGGGGAQGSRTDAGPQMEVGDQGAGGQEEARRRLRVAIETANRFNSGLTIESTDSATETSSFR